MLTASSRAITVSIRYQRARRSDSATCSHELAMPWEPPTVPLRREVEHRIPNNPHHTLLEHAQLLTPRASLVRTSTKVNRGNRHHSNPDTNTSSTIHMWQTPNLITVPSLIRIMRTFHRERSHKHEPHLDKPPRMFHRRTPDSALRPFHERLVVPHAQPRHHRRSPLWTSCSR